MKTLKRSVLFYQEGVVPSGGVGGDGEDGCGKDNCGRGAVSPGLGVNSFLLPGKCSGRRGLSCEELIRTSDKSAFVAITNGKGRVKSGSV